MEPRARRVSTLEVVWWENAGAHAEPSNLARCVDTFGYLFISSSSPLSFPSLSIPIFVTFFCTVRAMRSAWWSPVHDADCLTLPWSPICMHACCMIPHDSSCFYFPTRLHLHFLGRFGRVCTSRLHYYCLRFRKWKRRDRCSRLWDLDRWLYMSGSCDWRDVDW